MSRWFRFHAEALNNPKVQKLDGETFRARFLAAVSGEQNDFSRFIRYCGAPRRVLAKDWASIRSAVFERDDFTCQYCGDRAGRLECDHRVPVCRGGTNELTNLATACRGCNRRKSGKTVEQFLAEMAHA
jgi:5-methylcytosine-specific restriction endonuclease McrA